MNIRVVCFDADGVLVNPQMQFSRLLREKYAITPEMTRPFFNGIFNDCLEGRADLAQELPNFFPGWGWQDSADSFIRTWLEADHVVDARLVQKIQWLRRQGLRCCLTTSQEHNRADYMKTSMGFTEIFDELFFSCELGCQKPDISYFQAVQSALYVPRETVLFWDDNMTNVDGARRFGWQAEHYTAFEPFCRVMDGYLDQKVSGGEG